MTIIMKYYDNHVFLLTLILGFQDVTNFQDLFYT